MTITIIFMFDQILFPSVINVIIVNCNIYVYEVNCKYSVAIAEQFASSWSQDPELDQRSIYTSEDWRRRWIRRCCRPPSSPSVTSWRSTCPLTTRRRNTGVSPSQSLSWRRMRWYNKSREVMKRCDACPGSY